MSPFQQLMLQLYGNNVGCSFDMVFFTCFRFNNRGDCGYCYSWLVCHCHLFLWNHSVYKVKPLIPCLFHFVVCNYTLYLMKKSLKKKKAAAPIQSVAMSVQNSIRGIRFPKWEVQT